MVRNNQTRFVLPNNRGALLRFRWRLHELLEAGHTRDRASLLVDTVLVCLIISNVIVFALSTISVFAAKYRWEFEVFNLISVAIFTLEYVSRLWVCVELPPLRNLPSWKARLKFAGRPLLVVDLLAILPFYLGSLLGVDLKFLRILRLFRFFKIARYSPALQTLMRVLRSEAWSLFGALIIMVSLILISSTLMYFAERGAQPESFGSIPDSMWFALATLTTVGFGDVVPITPLGKIIGGLFMIFGLALYALPIGILSSGFAREYSRWEFVVTWNMVAKVPIFSGLSAHEVASVTSVLESHRYLEGSAIMRSGEPADSMYFIMSGEVSVDLPDGKTVTLGSGDHFGEMALLEDRPRRSSATAKSNSQLLQLDKDEFHRLLAKHPEINFQVRRVAQKRSDAQ